MKKTFITITTGIALTFASFSMPVSEKAKIEAATQTYIEAEVVSAVNFRTDPSTSSRVMGTLPTGTNVRVLDYNNYWAKIYTYGRTGYVSINYLRRSNDGQATPETPSSEQPSQEKQISSVVDNIIAMGLKYKGTPYEFGARSGDTDTFDCSSFMQYIFDTQGVDLPRSSRQQAAMDGPTIRSKSELQKGDLIFFKTGNRSDGSIDHVAVYMGNNKILHAIPNGGVQVDELSGFWIEAAVGAKRVLK